MAGKRVIDQQTMGAHIVSEWYSLAGHTMVAYQIFTEEGVASPDHVGQITFDVTNDPGLAEGKEVPLSIPEIEIHTGSEFVDGAEITELPWTHIRAKYTRTSGGDDDKLTVILAAE
jgi:hypothetical protein